MIAKNTRTPLPNLYEDDETAWLERTARLIDNGKYDEVDCPNLAEFLEDTAISQRREVESRLQGLMAHLLKWEFQPDRRSRSWKSSIRLQREGLAKLCERKTLKNHAAKVLAEAYRSAVLWASAETDLPEERFPSTCPYTVDGLLSEVPEANDNEGS